MFNFLHTFEPSPILISFGPFNVFYYGFFIVCGILLGSMIIFKLAEQYDINKNTVIDSAFIVVLSAIAGGRLYHVFLELPYYMDNPLNIIMVWRCVLEIHGAIICCFIAMYFFAKKNKLDIFLLAALYAPALALGQAIGRWGNYFNQELYGLPTNLAWGIPIESSRRVAEYYNFEFFHPTFLYESIGNLLIFIALYFLHKQFIKKKISAHAIIVATYLLLYSILRFSLEFVRIDKTPDLLGLRLPQIASIFISLIAVYLIYKNKNEIKKILTNKPETNQDTKENEQ